MLQAVAQALTASPRLSPLLLPHMETAIQDASPNTQSQAAGILRELQRRVGWGVSLELAGNSETMTRRWAETLEVSLAGGCEIGGISGEHGGIASGGNVGGNVGGKLCGAGAFHWAEILQSEALAELARSPVSPRNGHLAGILETTTAFPALFERFETAVAGMLAGTKEREILWGLAGSLTQRRDFRGSGERVGTT